MLHEGIMNVAVTCSSTLNDDWDVVVVLYPEEGVDNWLLFARLCVILSPAPLGPSGPVQPADHLHVPALAHTRGFIWVFVYIDLLTS